MSSFDESAKMYNVCVFIGEEPYHVAVKDHDTCGLLLSECMRMFMERHGNQDPGLLGLKILEGSHRLIHTDIPCIRID